MRVEQIERFIGGLRPDAPYQKPFLWPVAFPEVFQHGGFDIVLANPPYVRQEKLAAGDQQVYAQAFPEVHTGTADILVYFYARAIQILRDGGWLSFITSNKYMRAGYGERIRAHLPQALALERVVDFGDLPLFEANGKAVAAYPVVSVGSEGAASSEHRLGVVDLTYPVRRALDDAGKRVNPETVREALEDMEVLIEATQVADYPQVLLKKGGWILEDPALVRLFERLMSQGRPLGELVQGRMYYGIKTGLNEAFVIDAAKRAELIAADPRSSELIKPWLRGRDIKRWRPQWAGLYVIAVQNSGDGDASNPWAKARTEAEARRTFASTYPLIHDHLSRYEARLRPRADQGRFWWELRSCSYYREFERPKVVWPEFARRIRSCYADAGVYLNNKCYFWADAPTWSLAVLNSELVEFLLCMITSQLRGGFLQLYDHFVRRLPLVVPGDAEARGLVREMNGCDGDSQGERAIEAAVRSLYGLSAEQGSVIDEWFRRRSLAAGTAEDEGGDEEEG